MKIRILGGGWYGCHLALALRSAGHQIALHEKANMLFSGASGNQPGRLHLGFHYPRSKLTRAACQDHNVRFMQTYGHLTRGVPLNIYAIAKDLSLVDFGNYCQSLREEVEFVRVSDPIELGLKEVEGAVLTGERHTVIRKARQFFAKALGETVWLNSSVSADHNSGSSLFDLTIDCTFCANDSQGVDRYEPCVTTLLKGPSNVAITIMDGPFPSLYPWDPEEGISSLTSASLTPLSKECRSYDDAKAVLASVPEASILGRCRAMIAQMERYYPSISKYDYHGHKVAIRAMPLSGADARLVDVVRMSEKVLRIRASKLDAIFYAEDVVKEHIKCLSS